MNVVILSHLVILSHVVILSHLLVKFFIYLLIVFCLFFNLTINIFKLIILHFIFCNVLGGFKSSEIFHFIIFLNRVTHFSILCFYYFTSIYLFIFLPSTVFLQFINVFLPNCSFALHNLIWILNAFLKFNFLTNLSLFSQVWEMLLMTRQGRTLDLKKPARNMILWQNQNLSMIYRKLIKMKQFLQMKN